jgi:hypothetical protein
MLAVHLGNGAVTTAIRGCLGHPAGQAAGWESRYQVRANPLHTLAPFKSIIPHISPSELNP